MTLSQTFLVFDSLGNIGNGEVACRMSVIWDVFGFSSGMFCEEDCRDQASSYHVITKLHAGS